MIDDFVLVERADNGVATLQLNRPPMNSLSQAMLAAIGDAARNLAADDAVKAVVVSGSDKAFAAGADIKEFSDAEVARVIAKGFRAAFDAVAAIPRPVIAAMRGYALGGGLELAMTCDLRVAADTARVGQPEILLGIIPGAGGTQRLPRLVGLARAKELIWSGRQVRADEAHAIGLVDRVVPADQVLDTAQAWASDFAKGAVVAMGLAKRVIDIGLGRSLATALDDEADAFVAAFDTEDARGGVASFLEHGPGKARFTGR
ncbi:MAG: enoyl-CoA hydratase/isomerase family protein [Actinomycetota bacterium]